MAGLTRTWQPVGVESALEGGPSITPAVPHRGGQLELLPFEALTWQDFESLQWRVLRDVEGLRHAQIYGDPGQRQFGLDLVAVAADGSGVALQSKRAEQFGPAKITAAVDAFRTTKRPFRVSRLILGVSREVRTTAALDRFKKHQGELRPIELELWDKRELSYKLKGAPEIVIEFFGNDIAEIFCDRFSVATRVVPDRDATAIRDALARTPEVTTGAGAKIEEANAVAGTDPTTALALVEAAQDDLTTAGFAGHAAKHESLRASLLVEVGRGSEATRRRLDQLWLALDQGLTTFADSAHQDISKLVQQIDEKAAREHKIVAETAAGLYNNPLASIPPLADILAGETLDRARLAVLAGETALAADDYAWLKAAAVRLRNLAEKVPAGAENDALRVRLRVLAAEGSGNWKGVVGDARSLRLGYDLCALVQARHARHLALGQQFELADAAWDEAAGNACLARRWTDASRWIFSRRAFMVRWSPFTSNELLPIQTALSAHGPDPTVLTRDEDALTYARERLADDKLRAAAIAAQRALRDAVTLSDWEGERRARRLLADVLISSGEHLLAAHHLVRAGEAKAAEQLGTSLSMQFLDVTAHLNAQPWWVVGAAYRLLATQADLVPDDLVDVIASSVIADLQSATNGTLVDLSFYSGSRFLGGVAALAGISSRLRSYDAGEALAYFGAQPYVGPNQYRYHDDDEARVLAGVVATHPDLAQEALQQLVHLLGRSQSSRKATTLDVVVDQMELARPMLEEMAANGNDWAREMIGVDRPQDASADEIQEARVRLEQRLPHTPGVYSVGGGSSAVADAALVRTLPVRAQEGSLRQLIDRGASPYQSAPDRGSYLIAASTLLPPTSRAKRVELLDRALDLVLSPPSSAVDAMDEPYRHPLGAFRVTGRRDSRGEAAHLAAALATTRGDKERVRTATLGLVGDDSVSEYWVTRALQRLGDTAAPDVGFLSGQNWALRSFAAILWSKTTKPSPVGYRLAADQDVRVRRALALHLRESQGTENEGIEKLPGGGDAAAKRRDARSEILDILREDPCYSVRRAATGQP